MIEDRGYDHLDGWINGQLYEPTKEVFGILPVLPETKRNLNLASYVVPPPKTKKKLDPASSEDKGGKKLPPEKHTYLARRQGTKMAVLPLAGLEEKALFNELMRTHPTFARNSEPNWDSCARVWTEHSNIISIFYKVSSLHWTSPLAHDPLPAGTMSRVRDCTD